MNGKIRLREKWQGLMDTVTRFPMAVLLLVAAVVSNALAIDSNYNNIYSELLVTFLLGASIYVVFQMLHERFFDHPILKLVYILATTVCSIVYFMIIHGADWRVELTVRTTVIFFILLTSFLWIPAIRSKISINESFMAAFKSFFSAGFFSTVLYLGVVLVIGAIDILISNVQGDAYVHAANLVFVLFAPIYFLSMIPRYGQEEESDKETISSASQEKIAEENRGVTAPNRFLATLITYVIIPITAVFTAILLLYILLNISGKFWSESLMEPILVTYSITVIIVYILASTVEHSFARYFRKIFPKVLVPVVLFQTLASVLKIQEEGVTYGRYYVILFGVFATVAGILFCFLPVHKNGRIAPILILLSVISIIPPVDAFTVSRVTQTARLEKLLVRNNMLKDGLITPNTQVGEGDRTDIVKAVEYLDQMNYTKKIDFLGGYSVSRDFEKSFGFPRYGNTGTKEYSNFYYRRNGEEPLQITGYDYMVQWNLYTGQVTGSKEFEIGGIRYRIKEEGTDANNRIFLLEDGEGRELIRYELNHLLQRLLGLGSEKEELSTAQMTDTVENDAAAMSVIANIVSISERQEGRDISSELILLVHIKE
ncbi:hypothetical protein HNQ56_000965 [Anaerotaenia torta]|uniref:DUF4153 domain-containing protein n=1 Tax=Anaerotaenia torta TaxID=433293 RepID=UPI003D1D13B3